MKYTEMKYSPGECRKWADWLEKCARGMQDLLDRHAATIDSTRHEAIRKPLVFLCVERSDSLRQLADPKLTETRRKVLIRYCEKLFSLYTLWYETILEDGMSAANRITSLWKYNQEEQEGDSHVD